MKKMTRKKKATKRAKKPKRKRIYREYTVLLTKASNEDA
jgi:hypothetical protein